MKVEIWSDVVCPWCYIGKRRLEKALARFDRAADVEIEWRSFQLNPAQPTGVRQSLEESLAHKTGGSIEQVRQMNARIIDLAAGEGLEYHLERYQVVNTFDVHRVTHLAKAHGLGPEAHERFLHAQLVEGEVLDDPDTLVRLAAEIGVPAGETRRVLETNAYAADVHEDIRQAHALGVTGVPFFVIDRRYGISGAQPSDVFLDVLSAVRDEAVVGVGTAAGH